MILTDSTAVCGPADFSLKDEANRKKLKNFIIEQLYPDDPDGWRAALSVFAVPVWNRFETVWYAPQEIILPYLSGFIFRTIILDQICN